MDREKDKKVLMPGGLSSDTSFVMQPHGSTRFVLNAVNETDEGDRGFRFVEEANSPCYQIPRNFVPIEEVYIGNEETLLFLADGQGNSMLAIADRNCNFNVILNDSGQTEKLGFSLSFQIMATFRLRRGCERTVYWVDPKPRAFIIDKPEDFQDENGDWAINKFNLFKLYSKIPRFESLEVLNTGGVLPPGGYNVSIQYLDNDLNPTEFIRSTQVLKVYNDNMQNAWSSIRGSSMQTKDYYVPSITNKSIRVTLSNLDESFPFYRLAFTESNSGSGLVSDTKYTSEISTRNNVFTYTGSNFESTGTQEDIVMFNNILDSAETIEQAENILLLGGGKGKQVNFCGLQKYASRIRANLITKPIILNSISDSNPKKGSADFDGVGYMPGEIYSFGVVYIFEDMTLTPVYHIPGRAANYPSLMSTNNLSSDNRYIDNDSCGNLGYWGTDSEGNLLGNTPVRHHRFPLRSEVNKPLFTEEVVGENNTEMNSIRILVTGDLVFPEPCITDPEDPGYDPNCTDVPIEELPDIEYEVLYQVDGIDFNYTGYINFDTWDEFTGQTIVLPPTLSDNIVIISVSENGIPQPTNGSGTSAEGLSYLASIEPYVYESEEKLYFSEIFGIEFSGVELPTEDDLNGNKIIGYYIVRNERVEDEKTILDSAILTSTMKNSYFVSHGHLMPNLSDTSKIQKDILSMIHPEHKFRGRNYTAPTSIIQEGEYVRTENNYSRVRIQDVMDGSSHVKKRHKGEDNDGWDLHIRTRDNILSYNTKNSIIAEQENIKEVFYLDALTYKTIEDSTNTSKDVFNIACDNRVGIVSLNQEYTGPIVNTVPYVLLKRDIANPYSNFRTLPYYMDSKNYHAFVEGENTSTATVFGGDVYVTPMRYVNSLFYDNKVMKRRTKKGLLTIIVAAVLIVVGTVLAFFTAGASVALIAVGVGLIGAGAALASSGLKQDAWSRAYNELYQQGLRETVLDDYTAQFTVNPPDDEIQWVGESMTNLWFESQVNMALRQGANTGIPDFMDAPGTIETGNGLSGPEAPATLLDRHMLNKLTVLDPERKGGRSYLGGIALAELYEINPDYFRRDKQKIFNHLALEYDCCSDCQEDFPHRVHASLQAFQEELTDNFRTFLPNNYIDLEGETGPIVDMFRWQDRIFIHTTEALWYLSNPQQERVTGDIVSFIGTGSFFAIPPKKIVDDQKSSAGNSHRNGRIKTRHGILFPCHKEKKWYLFNGELKAITDTNMFSEFKKHMNFLVANEYYSANQKPYPYEDNPANPIGVGYISVYDTQKERLIVTKKDLSITNLPEGNYEICNEGQGTIVFENFDETVSNMGEQGFQYVGIENCRLKFQKIEYEIRTEIREVITTLPNTAHVYCIYDTSGSFIQPQLDQIKSSAIAWYQELRPEDPDMLLLHHVNNSSERWLQYPSIALSEQGPGSDVLVISFVNESDGNYQNNNTFLTNPMAGVTASYIADYENFTDVVYPQFNSFIGICYPIITSNSTNVSSQGRVFVQHTLAAVKGTNYTLAETSALEVNSAFTTPQWATLTGSLLNNPYSAVGSLIPYNWFVKSNRNDLGTPANEDCPESLLIISPCQFGVDINTLLADVTTVIEIEVEIEVPIVTYEYIEGEVLEPEILNNSVTMSYSLKDKEWISWHSYLPSFYMQFQEKFYSWPYGGSQIWKHNKKGLFRSFYGKGAPFIIEFVLTSPISTEVFDGILFQTEARKWDEVLETFRDLGDITFNKVMVYNTRQNSGVLNMIVKNTQNPEEDYLGNQISNTENQIIIDRNERDWTANDFRDIVTDYDVPMFIKRLQDLQTNYFIDKVINPASINSNKDWFEMESFRDKFLVVRLIFDNFTDVSLGMNFTTDDDKRSER